MPDKKNETPKSPLKEGLDFYMENGRFVLTAHYLDARGYCCKNGCRHCPYGFKKEATNPDVPPPPE